MLTPVGYMGMPHGGSVKWRLPSKLMVNLPPKEWPGWATEMAKNKMSGEAGLGDTVARVVAPFGSQAFKEWYAEVAGVMQKTCQCREWKPVWNARYPYA